MKLTNYTRNGWPVIPYGGAILLPLGQLSGIFTVEFQAERVPEELALPEAAVRASDFRFKSRIYFFKTPAQTEVPSGPLANYPTVWVSGEESLVRLPCSTGSSSLLWLDSAGTIPHAAAISRAPEDLLYLVDLARGEDR